MLHVTTRRLVWLGTGDAASRGYAVPFRSLTMHAVSRDATDGGFSKPCIYAQIEGPPPHDATETSGEAPTTACDEDEREEEQDTFDEMTEARFYLDDSARLDELFRALCDCAALNPDDDADDDDDVYGGGLEAARGIFTTMRMRWRGGAAGRLEALDRFDAMLRVEGEVSEHIATDPGRFEDDEEEEDDA